MTQTDEFGIICHILSKLNMDNLDNRPTPTRETKITAGVMEMDKTYLLQEATKVTDTGFFASGGFVLNGFDDVLPPGKKIMLLDPKEHTFKARDETVIPAPVGTPGKTWVLWEEPSPISRITFAGQIPSITQVSEV